jgi:uncharacterized protein YcbK (DUF882 family)
MQKEAVDLLQKVRDIVGRPLQITSAYRCENHPVESRKEKPGTHNQGIAIDIYATNGAERYEIITAGLKVGATGIGVAKKFVHLDFRDGVPVCWTY